MRKTIRKWFWVWDFDKEEQWLNDMAAKGLCLVSVGWCRYEFEDCVPGEYSVRLELLKERPDHPESGKYLEFLEETGAEHVGSYQKWVYLRKKKSDGEFALFSDNESRVQHLTRIIRMITALTFFNFYIGVYNLFIAIAWDSPVNYLGFVNIALTAVIAFGIAKLWRKRQRLKEDQRIFE